MKIEQVIQKVYQTLSGSDIFYGHGIDNPWGEAVMLVFVTADLPLDADDSQLDRELTDQQYQLIMQRLKQRIEDRVPMSYLVNQAWFMGLPFYVDQHVLIPRSPFAEWIERRFEPFVDATEVHRILEIGTGSGCMAIACATIFSKAKVDAVDISEEALKVAARNVAHHCLNDRVTLVQSNCFAALDPEHQYDLIISNPPYVSQEEIDSLPEEYRHEPLATALYADNEGMAIVDELLLKASAYLSEQGALIVEVGYSDDILMNHYPDVPFTWLECEYGGQGLFLLTRQQLEEIHDRK